MQIWQLSLDRQEYTAGFRLRWEIRGDVPPLAIAEGATRHGSTEPIGSALPAGTSPSFTTGTSFSGSTSSTTIPPIHSSRQDQQM